MRISDWSSDVCSSDLLPSATAPSFVPFADTRGGGRLVPPSLSGVIERHRHLPAAVGMAAVVAHAAERRGEVASVGAVVLAGEGHRVPGILSAERQRQIALPYRVLQRVGYERLAFEVQPDRKSTRLNSSH